jgi:hypothetical protein
LVLADGHNVDFCESYQLKKEVISKRYELEINFHVTENHLQNNETRILSLMQNNETEILSLLQTRYLMQLQQDNQNFLRINLSKSEYDNIEVNSSSIIDINKPWFISVMRDGFRYFQINNYDTVSVSKNSDDLLVAKEFYKSYRQHGQNESFVCVIGDSAFICKPWQNKR